MEDIIDDMKNYSELKKIRDFFYSVPIFNYGELRKWRENNVFVRDKKGDFELEIIDEAGNVIDETLIRYDDYIENKKTYDPVKTNDTAILKMDELIQAHFSGYTAHLNEELFPVRPGLVDYNFENDYDDMFTIDPNQLSRDQKHEVERYLREENISSESDYKKWHKEHINNQSKMSEQYVYARGLKVTYNSELIEYSIVTTTTDKKLLHKDYLMYKAIYHGAKDEVDLLSDSERKQLEGMIKYALESKKIVDEIRKLAKDEFNYVQGFLSKLQYDPKTNTISKISNIPEELMRHIRLIRHLNGHLDSISIQDDLDPEEVVNIFKTASDHGITSNYPSYEQYSKILNHIFRENNIFIKYLDKLSSILSSKPSSRPSSKSYKSSSRSSHKSSHKSSSRSSSHKSSPLTLKKRNKKCKLGKVVNPKSGRCINKYGKTYKTLEKNGFIDSSHMSKRITQRVKVCKPNKIVNPRSGRCITKNGPTYKTLKKKGVVL